MNFYQIVNPNTASTQTYSRHTLQGNWYEDRCVSDFDKSKKRDYLLTNPNSWQYNRTQEELGQNWKDFKKTNERFSESSDNYINFQDKNHKMYVTTTRHAYDPVYKGTFREQPNTKDFFKGKPEELQEYRQSWSKRVHSFETTYKADVLAKTGKSLISNK